MKTLNGETDFLFLLAKHFTQRHCVSFVLSLLVLSLHKTPTHAHTHIQGHIHTLTGEYQEARAGRGGDWSGCLIRHIHQLCWAENWNGNVGLGGVWLPFTPGPELMICHFSQGHKLLASPSLPSCTGTPRAAPLFFTVLALWGDVLIN